MEKGNLWKAFFMILGAILGFGTGEVVDNDSKDCPEAKIIENVVYKETGPKVIAYVDGVKYFCDCIGAGCPCRNTNEILSELG